jgi:hypothetical protein
MHANTFLYVVGILFCSFFKVKTWKVAVLFNTDKNGTLDILY